MKRKISIKRSKLLCLSVLCMAIVMTLTVFETDASDEQKNIIYKEGYTYSSDTYKDSTGAGIAPTYTSEGYLFAGWYTSNDEINYKAVKEPKDGESYYAKFVPEEVLSIQAQVSGTLCDEATDNDTTSAIRFLTSIDSTSYEKIGFNIKKGKTGTATDVNTSPYVYRTVYAVDATADNPGEALEDYNPEEVFHSTSYYFKTWTIKNIKEVAYNTDITVTPYWITLDGTRVEGTKSIKTVNLGRSWVYVNASANEDDTKSGTRNHPFTNLADALDAVFLTSNGKVIIQENSTITTANDFTWEQPEKSRNITIIGENQETSKLDFSAISKLSINDGVIFDNMTLTLPTTVFANGHGFAIKDNVVSENAKTSIYGGSEGTSTKGATVTETNVEVYAGSYKEVWGGGKYCTITNDIHVTIKNANIYDSTGGDRSRVFGSGANDTVKGDIFVTIGGTFNATKKVAEFERLDHSRYSSVHGAGSGTVQGNTYVRIEDQAEVDYVYGGGGSSSEVKGTCHVELKGGTVFSIYGGGKGDNSTSAGKNADTSVVVTGGKVCQIIGGNGNSMTGNSYVKIAGGQVTRRIYGGCYNDVSVTNAHHVTGYSTVVIKDRTAVANLSGLDSGITAGSRSTTEYSDEIAVLICNDDSYADIKDELVTSYNEYDYLIQANAGGVVSSVGTRLSITPDGTNNAVVRLDDSTNGNIHAYMTSKGMSTLPELDTSTGKRAMYVVFGTEQLDSETVGNYEAKVGGTHFDTLENAIAEANELSTSGRTGTENPVVTLLKDVSIDSVLEIDAASSITVQSEVDNKYAITGTDSTKNIFKVNGTLNVNRLKLTGGYDGINVYKNTLIAEDVEISDSGRNAIYANGSDVTVSNLTVTGTAKQSLSFDWATEATVSEYNIVGTNSQVAVRVMNGANLTLINGTIYANNGYGIYMDGTSSKVKAIDTKVNRATGTNALVGISASTAQLIFEESETGEAYIDGKSTGGIGVNVIKGSFVLNGGKIRNNSATSGVGVTVQKDATFVMNGGTISNNTATEYGAGVYAVGSFTMNGGEISNNTATTQGGGVYVNESTFTMTGGNISDNTATTGGGVYVPASSVFTMQSGIISGNTATATDSGGGGIYVAVNGTFNMNAPEIEGMNPGIIKENVATKYGAGVLALGTFNMNAGTISNHGSASSYSKAEGAGVCLSGTSATFVMNGGEISNNYASSAGVGVSMRGGDETHPMFTMNGGTITGNHASGNVAGIVLRKGTFIMNEGAKVSNNEAVGVGGGISLDGGTTFVLNGGTFNENIAGKVNNDINLTNTTAYVKLAKQLSNDIHVSHGKTYANTTKIVEKYGDITSEHFQASTKCIYVKPATDGNWYVNEQGMLTKGPVLLQSTGKGYATLESAIAVAEEGETIQILENAEIANTIEITKSLKFASTTAVTIAANDTMTGDMFSVSEGKTLEIVGASEDAMISIIGNAKTVNVIHNIGTTKLTNIKTSGGKISIYVPNGSVVANNIEIHNTSDKGISVQPGANLTATVLLLENIGSQGLYFTGKDGQIATGTISDFEVGGTGSASVRLMDYCNVTLTNGTITTTTWGIATGNKVKNNTLNTTNVTIYAPQNLISGKKVLSIEAVAVDSYEGVTVLANPN